MPWKKTGKKEKQKWLHFIAFFYFVVKRKQADVPALVTRLYSPVGGAGLTRGSQE